jgi:hypothetical protein
MTKGKIKKGNKGKGRGEMWVIAPDGRRVGQIKMGVNQEDIEAAALLGAKGHEVLERSIHSHLDQLGVPREGRDIQVSLETIEIGLPHDWRMESDEQIADRIEHLRAQIELINALDMANRLGEVEIKRSVKDPNVMIGAAIMLLHQTFAVVEDLEKQVGMVSMITLPRFAMCCRTSSTERRHCHEGQRRQARQWLLRRSRTRPRSDHQQAPPEVALGIPHQERRGGKAR